MQNSNTDQILATSNGEANRGKQRECIKNQTNMLVTINIKQHIKNTVLKYFSH